MMTRRSCFCLLLIAVLPAVATASEKPATYLLRYRFEPGQTLRWDVDRRTELRATMGDVTETTSTRTSSVKVWQVTSVAEDGSATFQHRVEDVDMWHRINGQKRQSEARYNSRQDAKPPQVFQNAADRVGKPLFEITIDPRGKTLSRKALIPGDSDDGANDITIPLPEEPIPVGHTWSTRHQWVIPLESGGVWKVLARQSFTLESIKTGVATIRMSTQVLTPIHDPALEAKLIERGAGGTVRFDLDAGRVLSQQMDLDKRVIGFRGAGSAVQYITRFTERLRPVESQLAQRPKP